MKRRWLIRSIALLLVAVCSMAWGWSFRTASSIEYGTTSSITSLDSLRGKVFMSRWSDSGADNGVIGWSAGWHIRSENSGDESGEAFDGEFDVETPAKRFLGFAFWRNSDSPSEDFIAVAVPFWFIDSAAVLFGLYAWMKTRPQPNPVTAFPVEIKT